MAVERATRGAGPATENVAAAVRELHHDFLAVTALSGTLKGRDLIATLRGGYVRGRKEIASLPDEGLKPGGVVELHAAVASPPDRISALRIEPLRADPMDREAVLFVGAPATIRPPGSKGEMEAVVALVDAAVPVPSVRRALQVALKVLSDFREPGRPGFVIRAAHDELGVVAGACLPAEGNGSLPDAASHLARFRAEASECLEIMDAITDGARIGMAPARLEVVSLAIFPVAPERGPRFAAQAANHAFVADAGAPRFARATVAVRPDRRGIWRAYHLSPLSSAPTLVGVDWPEDFRDGG